MTDDRSGAARPADAVLVANDERRLVDANEAACELLGFTRDDLLELRIDDITPPELTLEVERMWVDFLARRRMNGVFGVRTSSGSTRTVHFAALADFPVPGVHLSRLRRVNEGDADGGDDAVSG